MLLPLKLAENVPFKTGFGKLSSEKYMQENFYLAVSAENRKIFVCECYCGASWEF